MSIKPEVKLTFSFNDRILPVNGAISHNYDKNGALTLQFSVGTVKLDKIKLKFENLNYVEEQTNNN